MSNSIAPGSSADVNVKVTALTTNPNVPVTYKTIILKKNLVNGVNTLTQEMMSATNAKYIIKYNYILGENITIPENCILEFDGGNFSNGTITCNSTYIEASSNNTILSNIEIVGTLKNDYIYYSWLKYFDNNLTFQRLVNVCNVSNSTLILDDDLIISHTITNIKCNIDLNNYTLTLDGSNGYLTLNIERDSSEYIISSASDLEYFYNHILINRDICSLAETTENLSNIKNSLIIWDYTDKSQSHIESSRLNIHQVFYKSEFFYVDSYGNINGDIYNKSLDNVNSRITVYPIKDIPIYIGNGTIKRINYNNSDYNGFLIRRGNVIFDNIKLDDTEMLDEATNAGLFMCYYSYNVTINNIITYGKNGSLNPKVFYIMGTHYCYGLTINNFCHQGIYGTNVWGNIAGDITYNINISNSKFNRIDQHYRLVNMNIDNTTIGAWGVMYHGKGVINISNCKFYCASMLVPRGDWGADFNGNIYIKNCTWYPITTTKLGVNIGSDTSIITLQDVKSNIHPNDSNYIYYVGAKNIYITNLNIIRENNIFNNTYLIFLSDFTDKEEVTHTLPNIYIDSLNMDDSINLQIFKSPIYRQFYRYKSINNNYYNTTPVPNLIIQFKNVTFNPSVNGMKAMDYCFNMNTVTDIWEDLTDKEYRIIPKYEYINCKNVSVHSLWKYTVIELYNSVVSYSYFIPFFNNSIRAINSIFEVDNGNESGNFANFKTFDIGIFISCIFDISSRSCGYSDFRFAQGILVPYFYDYEGRAPKLLKENYKILNCSFGENIEKGWNRVNKHLRDSFNSAIINFNYIKYIALGYPQLIPIDSNHPITDNSDAPYFSVLESTPYININGDKLEIQNILKGSTENRLSLKVTRIGFEYYDTTLNKPVYWDGTKWVDATGTAV